MRTRCWALLLGTIGLLHDAFAGERIVLCQGQAEVCRAATVLGDTAAGKWVRIHDRALLAGSTMPLVLYFSPRRYDEAMAGLSGKDREQAVARRREVVSKNLHGFVFQELTSDLLQVAYDAKAGDLDLLVETAAILSSSEARMVGRTVGQLLDLARHDLAKLLADLPKGPLVSAFAKEADAAGALAAEISKDPKQALRPFAEPMRAYLVPSVSKQYQRVLSIALAGHPHKWRGGVVVLVAEHELSQPPFKGQALKLIYPGQEEYLADLSDLTEAQLDRRLAARMRNGYDRSSFIARRAFHHAVTFHAVTARLKDSGVPWIDKWLKIAAMDSDNLRRVLAATAPRGGAKRNQEPADLSADFALAAAILSASPLDAEHAAKLASATEALSHLSRGWSPQGAR
jgi:hypothetical protein